MKEEKQDRVKALGEKGKPKKAFLDSDASMEEQRSRLQHSYFKAIKKDIVKSSN